MAYLAVLLGGCETVDAMRRVEVDFDYVSQIALDLSEKRYKEPSSIPEELARLDYDGYQKIRYKNDEYLWKEEGLPFAAGFYHLGYLYRDRVRIDEFTPTHVQHIPYLSGFFEYPDQELADSLSSSLDYAGLRISTDMNEESGYAEVASFLGASYFRAVGFSRRYGASARGLAVDAGLSDPEEFPRFTRFWIGKPLGNSRQIEVFSLMDSPSVTGAYRFLIKPGERTEIEVSARLFFRDSVKSLGIAPITSMYWRGENRRSPEIDYRPEVHDSDGLIVLSDQGQPIWRPLDLAEKTRLSYFNIDALQGFGLMQRDRSFESYQDLEAEYHLRPSVWIETKGDWGLGTVKLVELPTGSEFDDNIVAFWEPAVLPEKGAQASYEYTVHWTGAGVPQDYPAARVAGTRIGEDQSYPGTHVFVVDFEGYGDENLGVEQVVANVSEPSELIDYRVRWNPYSESWRVSMRVGSVSSEAPPIELDCQLVFEDGTVSEVWKYQWTP